MTPAFAVRRCPDDLIREAVTARHYLKRWPDPRSLPFGYALEVDGAVLAPDGLPWGACLFSKLQHHRQGGLFGYPGFPTAWQVLNLARVWLHESLQAVRWPGTNRRGEPVVHTLNVFSRMVSAVLRRCQRDWLEHHPPVFPALPYHVLIVVSYCELAHHDGTGYRAAGFERFGLTGDGTKEVYIRRLNEPRWRWQPPQAPLFGVAHA